MEDDLYALNDQFAIPGHVCFIHGPGGLAMAVINNAHALGTMTLAGGHVMTCTPHGGLPLLWVSPNASYTIGKAMRGGVPVCWPWFGAHPTDPQNKPAHGFARTHLWSVAGTRALADGSTEIRMLLRDSDETRALWPHPFELEVTATFGPRLRVAWTARNPGSQPFTYTGAFHPYYPVSEIEDVVVRGLEGLDYLDKVEGFKRKTQAGEIRFAGEVDRVYLGTTGAVTVEDPGWGRVLHITKEGSRTTVVWNPDQLDAKMGDVGAGEHHFFLCVEAANAFEDAVTVPPGGEGRLDMEIWAEPAPETKAAPQTKGAA